MNNDIKFWRGRIGKTATELGPWLELKAQTYETARTELALLAKLAGCPYAQFAGTSAPVALQKVKELCGA